MIEREEEARRVLLRDAGYIIEDKLWRAYGTLRYARSLTFDEAMNYLSGVRSGRRAETDPWPQCIYPQQAPDILPVGASRACRGSRADESEANLARARYVRTALERSGSGRLAVVGFSEGLNCNNFERKRICSISCARGRHVIEREEEARRVLLRDAGYIIEDKLWRAYGTLRYARSLTFDEAMNYLSGVRSGRRAETDLAASVYIPSTSS